MDVVKQVQGGGNSAVIEFLIKEPVLIIEDHRTLGLTLKTMVEDKWKCKADLASSFGDAKALLDADASYLVAVCDLNLPDAQYDEIIDFVKAKNVPIIALTEDFGEELREVILQKGVVDYVLKESINAYIYVNELIGRLAKNKTINILVAGGSMKNRSLLLHFLQLNGLQVLASENGREALAVLERNPDIRLMLVDHDISNQDGLELIIEARKLFGKDRLAIVGISSSTDPVVMAHFLKHGANDIIREPLNFEEVTCRVNQNLEILELIELNSNAANLDYLTHLYNRRCFFELGQTALDKSIFEGNPVVLSIIDLDYFKKINDEFGHDTGDSVLRKVAEIMRLQFADQLPARLGGEEFVVLMTGVSFEIAKQRLEEFRLAIENTAFGDVDDELSVTTSIGMTCAEIDDIGLLLYLADEKLYEAKSAGRNRLIF